MLQRNQKWLKFHQLEQSHCDYLIVLFPLRDYERHPPTDSAQLLPVPCILVQNDMTSPPVLLTALKRIVQIQFRNFQRSRHASQRTNVHR